MLCTIEPQVVSSCWAKACGLCVYRARPLHIGDDEVAAGLAAQALPSGHASHLGRDGSRYGGNPDREGWIAGTDESAHTGRSQACGAYRRQSLHCVAEDDDRVKAIVGALKFRHLMRNLGLRQRGGSGKIWAANGMKAAQALPSRHALHWGARVRERDRVDLNNGCR